MKKLKFRAIGLVCATLFAGSAMAQQAPTFSRAPRRESTARRMQCCLVSYRGPV